MLTTTTPLEPVSPSPAWAGITQADQTTQEKSADFRNANLFRVNPKWAAAVLLLVGLVWTGSRMPWPEWAHRSSAHEVKAPELAPTPIAAQAPDTSPAHHAVLAALPDPTPPSAATPPAVSTASTLPNADPSSASCDWRQRQDSASYESDNPIKAGNYIHFVAVQDAKLCVRDQKNQLTDLDLKAGSAQSVYGEPPFLVHSPSWQHLQAFFQGRRVMGTPEGAAYWVFKNKEL